MALILGFSRYICWTQVPKNEGISNQVENDSERFALSQITFLVFHVFVALEKFCFHC